MGKKRVIKKGGEELLKESEGSASDGSKKSESRSPAKKLKEGRVYIYSSYNNTLLTLTDNLGNVISNQSAGALGFKGTKKSTPFAASKVAEAIAVIAKNRGMEKLEIRLRGIGSGRDSALRSLGAKSFDITSIRDLTPVPHNGPRMRKVRRV